MKLKGRPAWAETVSKAPETSPSSVYDAEPVSAWSDSEDEDDDGYTSDIEQMGQDYRDLLREDEAKLWHDDDEVES
jgi:hypothetical protein